MYVLKKNIVYVKKKIHTDIQLIYACFYIYMDKSHFTPSNYQNNPKKGYQLPPLTY